MKIGIDANSLDIPFPCGIKNYSENLIQSLAKIDKKNIYYIFASSKAKIPKQKNFRLVEVPQYPFLKRQVFLPFLVSSKNLDTFHYLEPFSSVLINHKNIVTTVHDLDLSLTYPLFSKHFVNRIYCEFIRKVIFKKTNKFISNSFSTKKDLTKHLKSMNLSQNIQNIYLGVDKVFKLVKNIKPPKNYILCLGDFTLRKNINRVITSYSKLSPTVRNKYKLIIVSTDSSLGHDFINLARSLGISKQIIIKKNVTQKKLTELYNKSAVFLYVSLYEGFGLPILEAMASGTPVITTNYGATKEISGQAAILVNPNSTQTIKTAIESVLTSADIQKDLKHKGLKRAKDFNWIKTAKQTLAVYEK